MLSELLEQDHGQQVRSGEAPRYDVERRRRLRDRLARPAKSISRVPSGSPSTAAGSSPNFDNFVDPQQGQLSGAAMTTRSRGR
jgi:hypothetical protein